MQTLGHKEAGSAPLPDKSKSTPCIRRATRADVPEIVQLQTICLPHFHLVGPGLAFLKSFYSYLVRDPRGLLFVSEHDCRVAGFVAGFCDPSHLHQTIVSQKARVLAATAACMMRHPTQLPKFLADLRTSHQFKYEAACCNGSACELFTIAVQPRLRRQGHGRAMMQAFVEAAKRDKMNQLRVHFASDDNGAALFYRRLGFQPHRIFWAPDKRWLDEYILAISENGKVN
jgi:ribosomal protein S18 acetylase RimI-like enzyme